MLFTQQAAGLSLVAWCRERVVVSRVWWALPVPPARCLSGSPCRSLQPTRLLLFPTQCYVLLSKYVRERGKNLSVHLSVSQSPSQQHEFQNVGQELCFHMHVQLFNMQSYICSSVLNLPKCCLNNVHFFGRNATF